MREIAIDAVTLAMLALLADEVPVAVRRTAVLTGKFPGKILTDDAASPSWVAIWEAGDGTLFWGGVVATEMVHAVVEELRQEGEILIPFWSRADPIVPHLPPNPNFEGTAIDFIERDTAVNLESIIAPLPQGLAIKAADLPLFERTVWYADNIRLFGTAEAYLARGAGFLFGEGDGCG